MKNKRFKILALCAAALLASVCSGIGAIRTEAASSYALKDSTLYGT